MAQHFHFTEDTCGDAMPRRAVGGVGRVLGVAGYGERVQREWLRHSATSSVNFNNAARMREKAQSSSSLNGGRKLDALGSH